MTQINTTPAVATSLWSTISEAGTSGVNWLNKNSRAVAASVGEAVRPVWTAVSAAVSTVISKLGGYLATAKEATITFLTKAKDAFVVLPSEAKYAGLAGLAVGVALTLVCSKCRSDAVAETAPADANVAAAGGAGGEAAAAQQEVQA